MAVLDFLLWGFLNGNLEGDAWTTFDAVNGHGGHRGLEVWRRLVSDVIRKTHSERLFMESQVTQPAACRQISEVMTAIDNWDIKRYAWIHAGGRIFDPHEHCGIIIRMLPKALRDKAVTDMPAKL